VSLSRSWHERRSIRRILLRVAAVCCGLVVIALAELALRAAGWGRRTDAEDPFVVLEDVQPLFIVNPETGRYEIPKSRQAFFRPESFALAKPSSGFRVFCLGGSTVQGRPYSIETAFPAWLEIGLRAADPSVEWDVVNCGGVSYASYRLLPILREVLNHDPDLVIICAGHNEFLEERSYHPAKIRSSPFWCALRPIGQLHLYRVCRAAGLLLDRRTSSAARLDRARLSVDVDALLDHRGGLERYHRDDAHTQWVVEHFRLSLADMIESARARCVPVILMIPPANMKDCPPFKSEHAEGLGPQALQRFSELCEAAASVPWSDPDEKIRLLEAATRINPRHAGVHFHLGSCYEVAGRLDRALGEFLRAKEEDVCPLRLLESIRSSIRTLSARTGTPVIDAHRLLAERSEGGIPGREFLVDHIHPSITGHQIIADALLREMIADGLAQPTKGWQQRRASAFARHTASLTHAYFHHGLQRLERVQRWARGRWPETMHAN